MIFLDPVTLKEDHIIIFRTRILLFLDDTTKYS